MAEIITEIIEFARCSGHAIKMQRMQRGISQRQLAEQLKKETGSDMVVLNGSWVKCSRGTIERMENKFPVQFFTSKFAALAIQKILSNSNIA